MTFLTILHDWLVPKAHAAENYWLTLCKIFSDPCVAGTEDFAAAMAIRMAEFVATLVWGGCTLAIIWGAAKIASSGGNDEGKTQGKNIIVTAMIGFALALAAQVILNFADTWFVI